MSHYARCLLTIPNQIQAINRIVRRYPNTFELPRLVDTVLQAALDYDVDRDFITLYDYLYDNCGYSVEEGEFDVESDEADKLAYLTKEIYHDVVPLIKDIINEEEYHSSKQFSFAEFRLLRNRIHVETSLRFDTPGAY